MRFDSDWMPVDGYAATFTANTQSSPILHSLNDGRVLIAGFTGALNGQPFPGIARLLPNGAPDHAFQCIVRDDVPEIIGASHDAPGKVFDLAVQPDGKIVICGEFSRVNGVKCPHIARLNPDGSVDSTFQTPFQDIDTFNRANRFRKFKVLLVEPNHAYNQPIDLPAQTLGAAAKTDPPKVRISVTPLTRNSSTFTINGSPDTVYVLQARDSLSSGTWLEVARQTADSAGIVAIVDPDFGNQPMRFYRVMAVGK